MYRHWSSLIVIAALALGAGPARAQIVNGGFETGAFGPAWTTSGNTTVMGSLGTVAPDAGANQAVIRSGPASTTMAGLTTFLGIPAGSLSAITTTDPAIQGSAIKQTITVAVGDTLTFRWNFLSNDFAFPGANDGAFFCVVGPGAVTQKLASCWTATFVPAPGSGYATGQTGYATYTHTFTAAGTVTVGFGVIDALDTLFPSALLLDGVGGGGPPPPAGVTIVQSGGSTTVAESGPPINDTYTIALNSTPTANVSININPGPQLSVAPATLTFTPANATTPQTVTLTAINDAVPEGPHTGTITHTAVSTDLAYNGIAIASVVANILDDDGTPPPPQPPPTPPGAEGDYVGLNVAPPNGSGEGVFGFAMFAHMMAPSTAAPPPSPILRGPMRDNSGGMRVHNTAFRRGSPAGGATSASGLAIVGWSLLAGLGVGIAGVLGAKLTTGAR